MLRLQLALVLLCWLVPAFGDDLQQQRQFYARASEAAQASDWVRVAEQRDQLQGYPLAIYLDYYRLESRLRHVPAGQAVDFMAASAQTPLQLRFKDKYLRRAGRDRRWQDFLAVAPARPNDIELQCYYYRARLSAGDSDAAWSGAAQLWNHGASRPDACDPLFNAWVKAGKLDDELVWQRMGKAFENRRSGLITYSSRFGSEALQPWYELMLAVYRSPARISRKQDLPADNAYAITIVDLGFRRLVGVDLDTAMRLWPRLQRDYAFTPAAQQGMEWALANGVLRQRSSRHTDWLDRYLPGSGDDKLVERRLRWTMLESDWEAFATVFPGLSPAARQAAVWRYWHAHLLAQQGAIAEAGELWSALAGERHYYGFLAAERVQQAYSLNHEPLVVVAQTPVSTPEPGLLRAEELMYHGEPELAQSEWRYLLTGAGLARKEHLSLYAKQQGWYRFAIDAANDAKAWDRLELRFPSPYPQLFDRYAQRYNVSDIELMSIARRESAFFPYARSHVGARGLMQLMPRTADSVASRLGNRGMSNDLYDIETNLSLGGAYYRQLMDDYDDNRVFTLAAYNAGPHRVKRWRAAPPEPLSVAQWVEAIPFRETREYVQAVLAYQVVYDGLRDAPTVLFKPHELQEQY